jgi:hypothetical protein
MTRRPGLKGITGRRTRTRRQRFRRAAAGAAAAVAVGAGLVAGTAAPAHADPCGGTFLPCWPSIPHDPSFPPPFDFPVLPPDWTMPPIPPPEPITVDQQAKLDAMIVLLQSRACSDLVTGPNPIGGKDAFFRLANSSVFTDVSTDPNLFAEVFPWSDGRAAIIVYPAFMGATYSNPTVRGVFGNTPYNPPPSPYEVRAAMILHEVGHLTGAQSHAAGDPNVAFNKRILEQCFGARVG